MSGIPIKFGGTMGSVVLNLRDKWATNPRASLASVDALTPRPVKGDDYRVAAAAMRLLERFRFLTPDKVWFGAAPGMFRPGPRWGEAVKAAEAAAEVEAWEASQ